MSFTDLVNATKTALSSDQKRKPISEAHHELVGPCEVTVKVGSGHKLGLTSLRHSVVATRRRTPWSTPWQLSVRVRRSPIESGQLNSASGSTRSRSASMAT
jgi:hypothetical protein